MTKAHIANHYIQACITGAETQGFERKDLLEAANIPEDWFNQPDKLITEEQLSQLIKAVWRCTQDEFMGLAHWRCKNGVFALMAELAQQAKTLGGMLKQSARFYSAVYDGIDVGLDDSSTLFSPPSTRSSTVPSKPDGQTRTQANDPTNDQSNQNSPLLFYRLHLQDQNQDPNHLLQEFLLLMWQRFGSWLVGQQIPFASTHFNYPAPPHENVYREMFTGELQYNQAISGFYLHPRFLQLPIVRSESELKDFLKESPAYILHRPDLDDSLQTHIRLILQQYDFDQMPDLDQISAQLHLAPRTLRRKLSDEGSSLRVIKENLRKDYAIKLLDAEHLNIGEISHKTGFSEAAAFCRAFKRWTGLSPSDWRNSYV